MMDGRKPLTGARVLLVEDEMLVALSIEDTLVGAGCAVVGPITRVDRATALLQEDRGFDAAVLDLNLAGESAVPVADLLARHGIPFLVVTGYGGGHLAGTRHEAPVLAKPFGHAALVDAVGRLIGAGADGNLRPGAGPARLQLDEGR